MKVSVVIPAYNEEKYIENCLKSLTNQSEKPDEIIVVDNNCTDKTIELSRKYKVRVVREPKQGILFARNKGFDSAKYEIIARSDADTIVPNYWIKRIKRNFQKYHIDALTGIATFYDNPIDVRISTRQYMDFMKVLLNGKESLFGACMAIRKKIWKKVRGDVCLDNKMVHEDIDLGIHITKIGGKIRRDNSLKVQASARRWLKNPRSGFMEYPAKVIKTLKNH